MSVETEPSRLAFHLFIVVSAILGGACLIEAAKIVIDDPGAPPIITRYAAGYDGDAPPPRTSLSPANPCKAEP